MKDFSDLIKNNKLFDISYKTIDPEEVIHPRIVIRENQPCVYNKKDKHIPIEKFLHLLAENKIGYVTGYRSNNRQSTITFSNLDRVTISPRLQEILKSLRADLQIKSKFSEESAEFFKAETAKEIPEKTPFKSPIKDLSIDELEKKLALQREIGVIGEEIAYQYECDRLKSFGCLVPATNIEKISGSNVSAGYDLKSDFAGEKRFIEVKSSTSSKDGFYISENERKVLTELGDEAFIYLVHVDRSNSTNSTVRELANPFGGKYSIDLQPVAWYAEFDSKKVASS
jgi:Domain of unknown function (DUF3883)